MMKLLIRKISICFLAIAVSSALTLTAEMQTASNEKTVSVVQPPFPVKRQENREFWYKNGETAMARARQLAGKVRRAKNVILFVGDGMGISTVTAARILEGQLRGESGEENQLSFEQFPHLALSKTYSVNQQTSDSAPTMTAIITGVKTKDGILSVDQNVIRGDYKSVAGNEVPSLLEMAEEQGLATGIVSTARITHATPGACYAHVADRDWESDANLPADAVDAKFPDIARQLIEFKSGDGLEVALGGGRANFLPRELTDPEYENEKGNRRDNRNLADEWNKKYKDAAFVWNKHQFDFVDPKKTKHLLGLFERSHLKYEHDRPKDKAGEPSLTEMTTKAIDILSNNKKGYFLMVEAGRIDHAHHDGNAFRALTDTIELSNAVRATLAKVDLKDTLIIVTADHSHVFTLAGYPTRGNNVLGLVRSNDAQGNADNRYDLDKNGLPYTALGYQNGLGARATAERPSLTDLETTAPDFKQEAVVPFANETHGGEDVAVFAVGAGANLVHGVMEQNWIFQVMRESLKLPTPKR